MTTLWVDKYRPKDLQSLDYHKQQAMDLKNLVKDGDFPHLLIYGPMGAGKKTRIMCLLKELYGPGVEKLRIENMTVTTPSNKKLDIATISSNYHIEVNPSDVGIYDRLVVMDVIKNVAQTQQLNANIQREFKVIVLTDVDELTTDAQHALRRTMEKYISNCRLVLCANSISRVIPAIRSRCLCIRVPAPSHPQIVNVLQSIVAKENFAFPTDKLQKIADKSGRNLRRAILMCETCKSAKNLDQIAEPDWKCFIRKEVVGKMLQIQNIDSLIKIREAMYRLIGNGISSDLIFKTLVEELLNKSDKSLMKLIVNQAALHEHRARISNKEIVHLEAFVVKCMCFHHNMLKEMMDVVI